jgi:membrane-associated phospholipid phosphatase
MRDLEKGKSMPSGDAAACAYFCGIYLLVFKFPMPMYFCVPLVALGRVYVHCHWLLDTFFGSILGYVFAYMIFSESYFGLIAMPLFRQICG